MKMKFFAVIALSFLQGCTIPEPLTESSFAHKQLAVEKTTEYFWIKWHKKRLPASQKNKLIQFFKTKMAPGCHVRFCINVDRSEKAKEMIKVLKEAGFKKHQIAIDPFVPGVTEILPENQAAYANDPALFGIAVDHYSIVIPKCPDWSRSMGSADSTRNSSNFSCSVMKNFALMVSDPKDLVKPYASSKVSGDYVEKATEKYLTGASKTAAASSSGGASSPTASATSTSGSPTAG